jgi:hypothetical protein
VTNTITTDGSYFWTSSGAQSPRQNNFWGASSVTSSTGVSWYNALQVNLKKQMTHGLQFQTAYTWSKALDTAQGQKFTDSVSRVGSGNSNVFAQNPFERGLEWAPAGFDAAHNLRFNMLYRLPGAELQGLVGKVLGGWWFGTIIAAQTGSPFHPTVAADRARAGVSGRNAVRPNYVTAENIATAQPGAVIYDPDTVITGDPNNWFNANMFTLAPLGTVGNVGRHILRGPGRATWDMSVNKDFPLGFLGEAGKLQFRAEAFNVLNRANFGTPNSETFGTAATPFSVAGQITNTNGENRQIQLSLRMQF